MLDLEVVSGKQCVNVDSWISIFLAELKADLKRLIESGGSLLTVKNERLKSRLDDLGSAVNLPRSELCSASFNLHQQQRSRKLIS